MHSSNTFYWSSETFHTLKNEGGTTLSPAYWFPSAFSHFNLTLTHKDWARCHSSILFLNYFRRRLDCLSVCLALAVCKGCQPQAMFGAHNALPFPSCTLSGCRNVRMEIRVLFKEMQRRWRNRWQMKASEKAFVIVSSLVSPNSIFFIISWTTLSVLPDWFLFPPTSLRMPTKLES